MGGYVSIAFDGTTLAGREMLYSAFYSPSLDKAIWCPPQVIGADTFPAIPKRQNAHAENARFYRIGKSRKKPVNAG